MENLKAIQLLVASLIFAAIIDISTGFHHHPSKDDDFRQPSQRGKFWKCQTLFYFSFVLRTDNRVTDGINI